ncbi:MAG: helix-turn-helix transcriptional regulator, partial [Coriobacteriia bacterium]|nr:helix-turn-helix transcriptional regulator [Coriobacteriia bacterium]
FWACSMLCHRSSLLFMTDSDSSFLVTSLIICSFSVNILTMLTVSAFIKDRPERLARISVLPFVLSAVVGVICYSLVQFLGPGSHQLALVLVGAVFTGIGFGFLWGSWAEVYGRMHPTRNAILMVMVFVVTILVYFTVSGCAELIHVPAVFIMVFLPLISWVCLRACRNELAQSGGRTQVSGPVRAVASPLKQAEAPLQSTALPQAETRAQADGQSVFSLYVSKTADYVRALGTLWQLILGAMILSFLFGFVWQLTVVFTGSVNDAHQLPLLGNLVIGVILLVLVLVTSRHINLDFFYRFIIPVIIVLSLLMPWFIAASPITFNILMSTGYGVFDVVIWYMVAESSYDNRVSGFVVGSVVRSIALVPRLLGILIASLFVTMPAGSNLLLVALFVGSSYLLLVWLVAYRRYRRRTAASQSAALIEAGFETEADAIGSENGRLVGSAEPSDAQAAEVAAAAAAAGSADDPGSQANDETKLEQIIDQQAEHLAQAFGLTQRETEVLPHLLRGRSARYIAMALFISENTVRSHIRHILDKTGASSKQQLISMADQKLIEEE